MITITVTSFRPLAGFWFLNGSIVPVYASTRKCFRPLAGFWFLNAQPPTPEPKKF